MVAKGNKLETRSGSGFPAYCPTGSLRGGDADEAISWLLAKTFVIPAEAGIHGVGSSLRGQTLSVWLGGFTPLRGARYVLSLDLAVSLPCGERVPSFASPIPSGDFLRSKTGPRKGDPEVTVATRLPCDARANGPGPKLGPQRTWASDIGPGHLPSALRFSASPTGGKVKSQTS